MNINEVIQPTRLNVASLVEKFKNNILFVDNSFQRKLVWTEKQKIRLIETILINYPMPEVYLWDKPADIDSGLQKQSIVDGQQRISTMYQFITNDWSLNKRYLTNQNADYADMYWKDLSENNKRNIWQYIVNARLIPENITEEQIRAIFSRLNETDKSLNPQELLRARFSGKFLKASEKISNSNSFTNLNVFAESQVRRMGDISFCSSLLMFLRTGEMEESAKTINEIYDKYNDKYEEMDSDIKYVISFFEKCNNLYLESSNVRKMFTKPVHLYTLFCCDYRISEKKLDNEFIKDRIQNFVIEYENTESANKNIQDYRKGATARTKSASSRSLRFNALVKWCSATSL